MRYGELTAFEERPHSPYFGNADATPLFVVLLDEYERWTGDTTLVRELESEARAALRLDRRLRRPHGQRLHRRTAAATSRPGWRTSAGRTRGTRSPTATDDCPGSPARPASCRATPTTPRCAAPDWPAWSGRTRRYADQLERQAADLKRRFNRDFWVEDGEYFALALDRDGGAGRRAVVEHRPPPVERHRRSLEGEGGRRPPDGAGALTPAGACARLPRARAASTRSDTTSAPSGRSTTRSSPGACAATASARRPPGSRRASSTRPSSSTAGCPRRSAATPAR